MTVGKYVVIANDLREAIRSGEAAPGSMLPTGTELVNRYRVSRGTVQKAISILANEGLVTPMAGIGTVVRATSTVALRYTPRTPSPTWAQSNDNDESAHDQVVHAAWDEVDFDTAQQLDIEPGDLALHRTRHQFRGNGIVQIHNQWIPTIIVIAIRDEGEVDLSDIDAVLPVDLFKLMTIAKHPPFETTEVVGARMPDPEERQTLQLPVGVPVLTTSRVTCDEARKPLEASEFVAAADRCTNSFTVSLIGRR